jgi:hypothetical protein
MASKFLILVSRTIIDVRLWQQSDRLSSAHKCKGKGKGQGKGQGQGTQPVIA